MIGIYADLYLVDPNWARETFQPIFPLRAFRFLPLSRWRMGEQKVDPAFAWANFFSPHFGEVVSRCAGLNSDPRWCVGVVQSHV